jgi:hypothetical protein
VNPEDIFDVDLSYALPEDLPALVEEVKRLRRALAKSEARARAYKGVVRGISEDLKRLTERVCRE